MKTNKEEIVFQCKIHQQQALPLHNRIITIFGIIACLCIIGGIIAIIMNSIAKTEFSMFGVNLSTGHVGVAFIGIGLATTFFAIKVVLKSQHDLAMLPPDQERE